MEYEMEFETEHDTGSDAPASIPLDEYLALAIPAPPKPPPGIALEYPGAGPEGAPFYGDDRERFIRQTATYALEVGLSEYETGERLWVFDDEFNSPSLGEAAVRRIMAEERGRAR